MNLCVWSKTNGGMGSLYRSQHELVFVFRVGRKEHRNNVELGTHGRNRTGAKNLATNLREALEATVSIRTGETVHTMSKRRAIIEVAINRALKGDMRALDTVFKLCSLLGVFAREAEAASATTIRIRFVGPDGNVVPPEAMPEHLR